MVLSLLLRVDQIQSQEDEMVGYNNGANCSTWTKH